MTMVAKDSFVPRLSGGVFLALLDASKKSTSVIRKQFGVQKGSKSFTEMLVDLTLIADPSKEMPSLDNIRPFASAYRKCERSYSGHFPFNNSTFVASFSDRIAKQYSSTLSAMRIFVDKYFDSGNELACMWIIRGLLGTIVQDTSILDTDMFCCAGNRNVSKNIFCSQTEYDLAEFLLSIWFFIIKNRPDNSIGKDTFFAWHTQNGKHSVWEYTGTVGDSYTRTFTIRVNKAAHHDSEHGYIASNEELDTEQPINPIWTQDMDRVRALWTSVQGMKLEPIKKPDEITPDEQGYVFPLYAAYSDHLKRPILSKNDLTQQLQMDFEIRRQHFYEAETVRLQGEQALGDIIRGEFADLKDELLSCVWNTYMDDYDDGFKRMRQVMNEASRANCTKGNLIKTGWIGSGEKQGIGHMLAAEKRLIWVVDDNA